MGGPEQPEPPLKSGTALAPSTMASSAPPEASAQRESPDWGHSIVNSLNKAVLARQKPVQRNAPTRVASLPK